MGEQAENKFFVSSLHQSIRLDARYVPRSFQKFWGTQRKLLVFVHGFGETPQSFARLISAMFKDGYDTGMSFVSVYLPGLRRTPRKPGEALENCRFGGLPSEILRDFLRQAKSKGWGDIFLMGSDLGAYLAWQVASYKEDIGEPSSDTAPLVRGVITFDPHPIAAFAPLAVVPAAKVAFFPLLNPLIGEGLLGAGDFKILREPLENQPFWDNTTDFRGLQKDFMRLWKDNGAARLTCYYRDNFHVKTVSGQAYINLNDGAFDAGTESALGLHPATSVLMVRPARDLSLRHEQYLLSLTEMQLKRKAIFQYHTVKRADRRDLLHSDAGVGELASELTHFISRVELAMWSG